MLDGKRNPTQAVLGVGCMVMIYRIIFWVCLRQEVYFENLW